MQWRLAARPRDERLGTVGRSVERLCALSALASIVAALASCPASALTRHAFTGMFGATGSGSGQLMTPAGVAVNDATHDVYVADEGNGRVQEFSAEGAGVLAEFNGSGAPTGALLLPQGIAVDNSEDPLDPSAGDVYVVDSGHDVVDKFSATGTYIGQLTEAGGVAFGELDGVAVDPAGRVWVYQASKEIDSFNDALPNEFMSKRETPFGTKPGFAVDSEDNLYVNRGAEVVAKLDEAGTPLIEELDPERTTAVAVNQDTNDAYLNNVETIARFNSKGALVERFGAGHLTSGSGVAIDPSTSMVYASDSGTNAVDLFAAVVVPDVTTGTGAATNTTATLQGTVNPDGVALSSCEFEYGTTTEYGAIAPCAQSAGEIGTGTDPVGVSASIAGLSPRTVYHFRLVAGNTNGANQGADETFTTVTAPLVEDESSSDVTATGATLHAQINPGGADTHYQFEYGTTESYGTSVPVPAADAGAELAGQKVSLRLSGLHPNTQYHYRTVAQNALGVLRAEDATLVTQPVGSPFALPDDRAYEMVSPVDKNGGAVVSGQFAQPASPSGDQVAYISGSAFADAQAGAAQEQPYLASRQSNGWFTHALLPLQAPGCNLCRPTFELFSNDLSAATLIDGSEAGNNKGRGRDEPVLVPREPANNPNLFVRDNVSNSYQLVDLTPAGETPAEATLEGAAADLSRIIFKEKSSLTPEAPSGESSLYEWAGGALRLVSVLPGGTPVPEAVVGDGAGHVLHAVSNDGSRIFFTANGNLYLRDNGLITRQLDAPQGSGAGGGGQFMTATSDGSFAFFTDDASAGLTNDTVPGSGKNLYEYDVKNDALRNLTAGAGGADVQGVLGTSADGSYVYFVAGGLLAAPATPGGPGPTEGEPNLYLLHEGTTTFLATLGPEDSLDWSAEPEHAVTARVTSDGLHLAFQSARPLTGYDNRVKGGGSCGVDSQDRSVLGERCVEVFEYSNASHALTCASCNPTGARPVGSSFIGARLGDSGQPVYETLRYLTRNLSEDGGRLFFDSSDALLPGDTNGKADVYEFEREGVGTCARDAGCLYLITSGTSPEDSAFEEASANGDDVFFTSSAQLVPQDQDARADLYDARVGGGFSPPASPAPCTGESCRPPLGPPPPEPFFATTGVFGPGNQPSSTGSGSSRFSLLSKTIRGLSIVLKVRVPGEGRISAAGSGIHGLTRIAPGGGSFTLSIGLSNAARRQLRRRHRTQLTITVRYFPIAAPPASLALRVMVKR
jgi:NHL repeat-containing protein